MISKPFVVLTSYTLLPQLVNNSMLSRSMMRWLVELQEFDFSFFVETTSRATLADCLTYKDGPILVKEVEEKTAKEEQAAIPSAGTLFFDVLQEKSASIYMWFPDFGCNRERVTEDS